MQTTTIVAKLFWCIAIMTAMTMKTTGALATIHLLQMKVNLSRMIMLLN